MPRFTVVMATFNRGRHVLPSIRSVLQQDLKDFELLVIGDNCTDETGTIVEGLSEPRIRWINLATNGGSQSFPNNEGIRRARGRYVAYLGHDDIWEPGHLAALADIFETRPDVDFAVSGAILHMPNGMPGSWVCSIFDDDDAKHRHFFPPSTFAHRHAVPQQIGAWSNPREIRPPVDCDFLLRAAEADLRFASTKRVTVHKFTSTHRYLSYVRQESREQEEMLSAMARPEQRDYLERTVEQAKKLGVYMHLTYPDFSLMEPGGTWMEAKKSRGLIRRTILPLDHQITIRQEFDNCAFDWERKPKKGIRWHKSNPRPRLLIPVTANEPVSLSMDAYHVDATALGNLTVELNGRQFRLHPAKLRRFGKRKRAVFVFEAELLTDEPSLLEFLLEDSQMSRPGQRGIGIGDISAVAAKPNRHGNLVSALRKSWMRFAGWGNS
jgi:glycosyltransferase involved in cell wall biosynthesis